MSEQLQVAPVATNTPFDYSKNGQRYEVYGHYKVSVNDGNAYMTAGLTGLGVIQAPYFMIKPHIDASMDQPSMGAWPSGHGLASSIASHWRASGAPSSCHAPRASACSSEKMCSM